MSDTGRGQRVYRMIKQYLTGKGLRFEAHEQDLMIAFPLVGGEMPQRTAEDHGQRRAGRLA